MSESVSAARARQKLGDLLDRVEDQTDAIVIERRGRPSAALVSLAKLERLERAAKVDLLSALERPARRLTLEQAERIALDRTSRRARRGSGRSRRAR